MKHHVLTIEKDKAAALVVDVTLQIAPADDRPAILR